MALAYIIEGTTSDGETFGFGRHFETHQEAVDYAVTYASCVSGTDRVTVDEDGTRTIVRAIGEAYEERLVIVR